MHQSWSLWDPDFQVHTWLVHAESALARGLSAAGQPSGTLEVRIRAGTAAGSARAGLIPSLRSKSIDDRCAIPLNLFGPFHAPHPSEIPKIEDTEKNVIINNCISHKIIKSHFNKSPAHVSGSRNKWNTKNFIFLWDIIFMSEWLAMPHTLKAQLRVQWLATPLAWYTHFGSPHGVDQVPQFCLHRIELRTSRLTAQCYNH